jgi:DNA-binding transcriptional MerR regulator
VRIGQLAARAGVSPATCRYYERYGLLQRPLRQAGKRDYDPAAVDRLSLIAFAKRAGLSLAEIRELLRPGPIHDRWRDVRSHKLAMLRELESLLREQRRVLKTTEACRCTTPEECGRATSALLNDRPRRSRAPRRRRP